VDPNGALNDVFYGCYTHRLCINESSTLLNTVNSWFYDDKLQVYFKGKWHNEYYNRFSLFIVAVIVLYIAESGNFQMAAAYLLQSQNCTYIIHITIYTKCF